VAIGATIGLKAMFAGPICRTSMNFLTFPRTGRIRARSRLALDLLLGADARGALGGSGASHPSRTPYGPQPQSVLNRPC
jgi:hypothetical protein